MSYKLIRKAKGFLFDLDGVFIQSKKLLPGALRTIQILKRRKIPFRFLTNTTTKSKKTLYTQLNDLGIRCKVEHIFSAGYSGIKIIKEMGNPTCKLYISKDLKEDYQTCNFDNLNPQLIVIGDYKSWNLKILNQAFNYVMNGAQILALHVGKYYKTDSGLKLDAGAIVKGLEYATNRKAIVVGKPNSLFFKQALNDLNLAPSKVLMVGDDLYNDIYGALKLKIKGVLVKTGKYNQITFKNEDLKPEVIIDSIDHFADILNCENKNRWLC